MYSLTEIFITITLTVLIYMIIWFLLAVMLKRRDVVDSAWGLGFIVVTWMAYSLRNNDNNLALLTAIFVTIWGMRLFLHITSRNWKKKEDYRYAALGELNNVQFWLKTFLTVFVLQGVLMVAISLPVIAIMHTVEQPIVWLAILGFTFWAEGIITEGIADYQLRAFISRGQKGIMQSGLWHYSRHPNYFGEITSWWGAALVAIAFGQWWGIIGAVIITVLITRISGIPLLEKRYANDKDYQKYAKDTPILIPNYAKDLKAPRAS